MEGRTEPPASAVVQNLSPSTYRRMDKRSHSRVSGSKLKSYYLLVEGRTKPPASALVQNLSPSTYMWKDEPCHSWVSWSKFKSFYLWVEGWTKSLTSALVKILSPTTYGWKDQPSRPWVPWYKILVLLPTGGRTNRATSKCLSTKFKSFYIQVDGRTKSLTSVWV